MIAGRVAPMFAGVFLSRPNLRNLSTGARNIVILQYYRRADAVDRVSTTCQPSGNRKE